jgi:hypothetical protein
MRPAIVVAAIAAVLLSAAGWNAHQRQIGALQYVVRDDVMVARVARLRADSLERAFRVDTVRLFRRITNTLTVLDTVVLSDTLRLSDTVKVTVEVIRDAQETIRACQATVLTCSQLNEARQRQIDALGAENRAIKAQVPSRASGLLKDAGKVLLGYGIGRITR